MMKRIKEFGGIGGVCVALLWYLSGLIGGGHAFYSFRVASASYSVVSFIEYVFGSECFVIWLFLSNLSYVLGYFAFDDKESNIITMVRLNIVIFGLLAIEFVIIAIFNLIFLLLG